MSYGSKANKSVFYEVVIIINLFLFPLQIIVCDKDSIWFLLDLHYQKFLTIQFVSD